MLDAVVLALLISNQWLLRFCALTLSSLNEMMSRIYIFNTAFCTLFSPSSPVNKKKEKKKKTKLLFKYTLLSRLIKSILYECFFFLSSFLCCCCFESAMNWRCVYVTNREYHAPRRWFNEWLHYAEENETVNNDEIKNG